MVTIFIALTKNNHLTQYIQKGGRISNCHTSLKGCQPSVGSNCLQVSNKG